MATKLFLRPHSIPLITLPPKLLFPKNPKPLTISLFCFTTQTQIHYGPSLHKGTKPSSQPQQQQQQEEEQNDLMFDEQSFTRVFDLTALRVPAKDCFALESRLRGHLLNWPRIRNIARVPNDDVDPSLLPLLGSPIQQEDLVSLERRIHGEAEGDGDVLSPVLYRDKLAREFNARGFIKFRNLAKISRPKRKKKNVKEEERSEGNKGIGKNEIALVEVVEEGDEDLKGLLGDEFKGTRRKWSGPTRLLLLDERYAARKAEELPEAIKVVLKEDTGQSTKSTFELVRCKLTLFYDYWQMDEILEALLPNGIIVPSAFETVGHIAHLNLREEHLPYKNLIAKVVLDKNKPKIQTVVNKIDAIHNDYRTMQLEVLAGNHSLVTTVVENGMRFHVDLATVISRRGRLLVVGMKPVDFITWIDVVLPV